MNATAGQTAPTRALLTLGIGIGLAAALWGALTWQRSLAYADTDDAFAEGIGSLLTLG